MAQRKPYNPNTAYGRRKLREEAARNIENLPPAEKANFKAAYFLILLVILIVVFLIFLAAGNPEGFLKWANH